MDSIIALKSLQSNLYRQIKEIESNEMSSIIPSPTTSTDNMNTNYELSNNIENNECQFDNSSLYDPWDTKLEITYCNGYTCKYIKC